VLRRNRIEKRDKPDRIKNQFMRCRRKGRGRSHLSHP